MSTSFEAATPSWRNAQQLFSAPTGYGIWFSVSYDPDFSDDTFTPDSPEIDPDEPQSEYGRLMEQVAALQNASDADIGPPPTIYALRRTIGLLDGALLRLPRHHTTGKILFPHGFAYTTDNGGLRIEWRAGSRLVLLAVEPSESDAAYIYYHNDGKDGRDQASIDRLARALHMFPAS